MINKRLVFALFFLFSASINANLEAANLVIPEGTKFLERYTPDTPVAYVDDKPITLGDVITTRQELPPQIQGVNDKYLYEWVINHTVEQKLLAIEAKKSKIDKDPLFKRKLEAITDALMAKFYIAYNITDIDEGRIEGYYDALKVKSEGQKELHARHILVKTEKEAKEVLNKLKKGGDFSKLAQEYSIDPGSKNQGGDLGWFVFEQMTRNFSEAAFSLKNNELSSPVKTSYGYHVIQVLDKRSRVMPPLDDTMRQQIAQQIADRLTREFIEKIKKDHEIYIPRDKGIPKPQAVRDDQLILPSKGTRK